MTRVSNLFRIQALDSQIDSHQARLAEVETKLANHPELDLARAEEESARGRLESAKQEARQAEEEARRQQQHIADEEKTLYGGGVRNPKELQDLQEESASLRKFLSVLEERQLQAMMQTEAAEKALAAAQSGREEQERLRAEQEDRLNQEKTAALAALETLGFQREAAVSAVAAEDLDRYSALRKSKHGLAVARLENGSCGACGVAPSAARMDSARSGQEIVQCGNCGRILYMG